MNASLSYGVRSLFHVALLLLCLSMVACATTSGGGGRSGGSSAAASGDDVVRGISDRDYENLVESHTKSKKLYDGFNLAFEFQASVLTTDLQEAQVWIESGDFQWTRERTQLEREKASANFSKETRVFLSFFSPVHETDNLDVANSVWKIYLVAGGMKYEGRATRTGELFTNLQRKYPFHTRFNTPYVVTFNTPINLAQQNDLRFILTGTVGTAEVEFPLVAR